MKPPPRPQTGSPPQAAAAAGVEKLALRFNTIVCAAVLAAILSYCAAEEDMLGLAMFSIVACAIGWFVGRGRKVGISAGGTGRPNGIPRAIPRWVVNLVVVGAIFHAALRVIGLGGGSIPMGTPIVSVLAQFLVYIQLMKLLDRRTPRDDGHLLGLSVFIVIGAILTSNELWVGALLLIYTPLAITSAMMLQVLGGHRRAEWSALDGRPDRTHHADSGSPGHRLTGGLVAGRTHRRDFRAASLIAVLSTVILAAAAFILTPRGLGQDLMGSFGRVGPGAQVGFTDAIQLGGSGTLQQDSTPVMNVRVTDTQGQEIGEQLGTLYLRGAVRNRYNRSTKSWEHGRERDREREPLDMMLSESPDPTTSGPREGGPNRPIVLGDRKRATGVVRQEVTMRKPNPKGGYLFSMWRPVQILSISRTTTIAQPGREVMLRIPSETEESNLRYTVESAFEYVDPSESERVAPQFLDERIRDVAAGLLTARGISLSPDQREPEAIRRGAVAFQDYLRENCEYSTEMVPPEVGEDPINMFMCRTRTGHCEYFASAFVAMCQSVGIQARIIAGYLAVEYDGSIEGYVVRESNAHAWAEVKLSRGRWQRFDPSPPDAVNQQHKPPDGIFARLRKLYEAINFTWTNSVISFDRTKQAGIVSTEGIRRFTLSDLVNFFERIDPRRWLAGVSGGRLAGWLAFSVCLGVVGWLGVHVARVAWSQRGMRSVHRNSDFRADPALRGLLAQAKFHERLERVLRRAGLERPRYAPPLTHARAVGVRQAEAGRDVAVLADLYYRIRFGRQPLSESELAEAQGLVSRVEAALVRKSPAGASGTPKEGPERKDSLGRNQPA
ncbi:MAG: DUF3488 domain-containing protein [Pyrinomonadaceae bacterium]|nr:DUF3488 domain-containing protein [Phycisphaerales bacterium]